MKKIYSIASLLASIFTVTDAFSQVPIFEGLFVKEQLTEEEISDKQRHAVISLLQANTEKRWVGHLLEINCK